MLIAAGERQVADGDHVATVSRNREVQKGIERTAKVIVVGDQPTGGVAQSEHDVCLRANARGGVLRFLGAWVRVLPSVTISFRD